MKRRAGLAAPLGLLVLSALWAFGWLLPDLIPGMGGRTVALPLGQAIVFAAFAAMAAAIVALRRLTYPRGRLAWGCAGVGLGLFVVPTIATGLAQAWVSSFDVVAVLCLTAVFAVVLEPYLQNGPPSGGRAGFAGALAAMAGILCLIPLETPSSFGAAAALCVLLMTAFEVAAANCIAVRLARELPGRSVLPMAVQASGASAAGFAAIAVFSRSDAWEPVTLTVYAARFVLVDIPCLFLLFWLLRKLSASRMAARFLLAPLLAAWTGLALVRTRPTLREMLGMLLLAGGAGWLLFAPSDADEARALSIRAAAGSRDEA